MGSGLGYSTETLVRLAELPEVVAVKEGSGNPRVYEDNVLALSSLPSPVRVLTTNNEWWLADLALAGGDGILSGSGPVLAKEQVEIYRSVTSGDLRHAQEVHARVRPLLRAFYKAPAIDMHNRMKVALQLLGILPHATVRPPLKPIGEAERKEIRRALERVAFL
jgi:4-hydroxy-tetrahydrodipicolinate synthase